MAQLTILQEKRIHIAIMKKSWGLTEKILTGNKIIESRWYLNKSRPWNQIEQGDVVYFKNSGEPVTLKASVEKVLQLDQLNQQKVKEILEKYGEQDGIGKSDLPKYFEMFKNKKYCLLIFLKNVQPIKPFDIDKTGFGAMSAWITTNNINNILVKI